MVMAAQWLYEQVKIFSPLDVIGKEAADRLYLILVVSETCSKFGGQGDIRGEDAYGSHEDRPTDFPRFSHATTEDAVTIRLPAYLQTTPSAVRKIRERH